MPHRPGREVESYPREHVAPEPLIKRQRITPGRAAVLAIGLFLVAYGACILLMGA